MKRLISDRDIHDKFASSFGVKLWLCNELILIKPRQLRLDWDGRLLAFSIAT